MYNLNEKVKEAFTPGAACAKIAYGVLFFLIGLLFVFLGFWKALFVLALTLVGVFIGSAESLGKLAAKVLNKIIPEKNKKVVYTPEDLEKVRKAAEMKRENQEKSTQAKEEA